MSKFTNEEKGIEVGTAVKNEKEKFIDRNSATSVAKNKPIKIREIDKHMQECYEFALQGLEGGELESNLEIFAKLLRVKALNYWKIIYKIKLPFPGGIARYQPSKVTNLDLTRMTALLDALPYPFGSIEPEYLDLIEVDNMVKFEKPNEFGQTILFSPEKDDPFGNESFAVLDIEDAKRVIGVAGLYGREGDIKYIPKSGPLKKLNVEFGIEIERIINRFKKRSQIEPLSNPGTGFNIDNFFSELLEWDFKHCYGILDRIGMADSERRQGGGDTWLVYQAAQDWVEFCQNNKQEIYIYSRYPHYKDYDNLDHKNF